MLVPTDTPAALPHALLLPCSHTPLYPLSFKILYESCQPGLPRSLNPRPWVSRFHLLFLMSLSATFSGPLCLLYEYTLGVSCVSEKVNEERSYKKKAYDENIHTSKHWIWQLSFTAQWTYFINPLPELTHLTLTKLLGDRPSLSYWDMDTQDDIPKLK